MKINYWHYWFEKYRVSENNKREQQKEPRIRLDLKAFLSCYSDYENPKFKKLFHQNSDDKELLVLDKVKGAFIFLKTKNEEILKLIKNIDLSIEDIESQLSINGQTIAFASYLDMDKEFIVFGSTINGPSIRAFSDFVNQLLSLLGANLIFCIQPVNAIIKKDDLNNFDVIGTTEIVVPKESGLFKALFKYLKAEPPNGIGPLTIKISSERNVDISETIKKIAEKDLNLAEKFKIRAKVHAGDVLLDYFLTKQGQKNIVIEKPKNDNEALHQIKKSLRDASLNNDKITGFEYEELGQHIILDIISDASDFGDVFDI